MADRLSAMPDEQRELIVTLKNVVTDLYEGEFDHIRFERVRFDFSVTFSARTRGGRQRSFVIRLTPGDLAMGRTAVRGPQLVPYTHVNQFALYGRNYVARVRPWARSTMANELKQRHEFDESGIPVPLGPKVATVRLGQVRELFAGLATIHSHGALHGDVRPANVALNHTSVAWMDYDDVLPTRYLYEHELPYAAPEALKGEHSAASDTYSAGRIAKRMLNAQSMNFAILEGVRVSHVEVIKLLDATVVSDPADRPTAVDVAFLLGSDLAVNAGTRSWARWFDGMTGLGERPHADLYQGRWLTAYRNRLESWQHGSEAPIQDLVVFESKFSANKRTSDYTIHREDYQAEKFSINERLPRTIDSEWEAQIADRLVPTDQELDAPMKEFILRALERNVTAANKVRSDILARYRFVSEAWALSELTRRGVVVKPEEVVGMRDSGALIAVRDHDEWIYPAFQFEAEADVELITAVQAMYADVKNGWGVISWWLSPEARLANQRPSDVLVKDPDALWRIADFDHYGPLTA